MILRLIAFFFLALMPGFAFAQIFPSSIEVKKKPGQKPRNVIFILTDDHRYDAMGFMGHPFLETPGLDSMAEQGVHLKNAFVTTSLCSPSRASILTGLYTHKHLVIDNQRDAPSNIVYFSQYLQDAGYATAYLGKWHMGGGNDEPRAGFDHWISFKGQGHYLPPSPDYTLNVNGKRVKQKGYITDELNDYAIDWLKEQKPDEKPFFMYLSHKAVHANFTPAERHEGSYRNEPWEVPSSGNLSRELAEKTPRWVRDQRNSWHGIDFPYHSELDVELYYKKYCEAFRAVDEGVIRIMDQLKKMGIYEETLVVYMGDNGFMFGEHGLIDKRVAYETSIRVPMLMQCPELFKGGTVVEEVVANIDIGPTVLDAMGLETPPHMDGKSFIALGQKKEIKWRDYFLYVYYWEKAYPQSPTVFSLRGDRYKYITYYGLWDTDEFFDLHEDPGETNNLINDPKYKDIIKEMDDRLYAMLDDAGAMAIPLNQPGRSSNLRYSRRGGWNAADFPSSMVVDEPPNKNAH
jgi:N-acetylglucosamine-6-sulfatase